MYIHEPIYIQIFSKIKSQIQNSEMPEGSVLPSLRKAAVHFSTSKNTILQAYEMLSSEGLVYKSESKYKVAAGNIPKVNWSNIYKKSFLSAEHSMTPVIGKNESDEFSHTVVANEFGFMDIYRKALHTVADTISELPLDFNKCGLPDLRCEIARYLRKRGIISNQENIVVMSSERVSMYVLFNALKKGATILSYNPSRLLLHQSPVIAGLNVEYLKTDAEGIIPDDLYTKIKNNKNSILYFEPLSSWPVGIVTSTRRLYEITEICFSKKIPVIEVDYRRDQFFGDNIVPPVKSLNNMENIIYATGFLLDLNPRDNIACLVVPESFMNRITIAYNQINFATPSLSQLVLAEMLRSDTYEVFMQGFREKLKYRHIQVQTLLQKYLGAFATWTNPSTGVNIFIQFDIRISVSKMKLPKNLCMCHYGIIMGKEFHNSLLLWITSATFDIIERFIEILREEATRLYSK